MSDGLIFVAVDGEEKDRVFKCTKVKKNFVPKPRDEILSELKDAGPGRIVDALGVGLTKSDTIGPGKYKFIKRGKLQFSVFSFLDYCFTWTDCLL